MVKIKILSAAIVSKDRKIDVSFSFRCLKRWENLYFFQVSQKMVKIIILSAAIVSIDGKIYISFSCKCPKRWEN